MEATTTLLQDGVPRSLVSPAEQVSLKTPPAPETSNENRVGNKTMRNRARGRYFACLAVLLLATFLLLIIYRRHIAVTLRKHQHLFQFPSRDLAHVKYIRVLDSDEPVSKTVLKKNEENLNPRKLVLLWSDFFGKKDYIPSTEKQECLQPQCEFASNRELFNKSDAVIFHFPNLHSNDLPAYKRQNQRWILLNQESPSSYDHRKIMASFNGLIDYTITYRYVVFHVLKRF